MAQIDIDKFVISLRRCFGENKGIATSLDRCLLSLGLQYVDTPTGGRLERVDQPTMLEKIMWGSGEQKPWSEEDELQMQGIIDLLPGLTNRHNWLKSIKDRVQPQQEWSEEDKKRIEQICDDLKSGMINFYANEVVKGLHYKEIIESNIEWLKSLRPQSTWKPSDEQMEALEYFIVYHNDSTNYAKDLEELRLQLKKLRGSNSYE